MRKLIIFGLIGGLAQLIDGALGMAYGVTSTSLLLTAGLAPAAASASVHLAELGTTFASGVAHWRFGNVDWRIVGLMTFPGAAGAFLGAVVLSSLSAESAEPIVASILLVLGAYIVVRFARRRKDRSDEPKERRPLPKLLLSPLGGFAGFMDAVGGGGWGPIGTPTLLASGRVEPRKAVGSVDTGEFMVSLGASVGFLVALSFANVNLGFVLALLVGGVVVAPLAAWLVRSLPARVLGLAVGGLIVVTNLRTLAEVAGIEKATLGPIYVALVAAGLVMLGVALAGHRRRTAAATT
ncbi:MAG: sulfite exporter TauE/SafE family protein [Thermoleophilaceae bacterium]